LNRKTNRSFTRTLNEEDQCCVGRDPPRKDKREKTKTS
jgi:hypothetical protein